MEEYLKLFNTTITRVNFIYMTIFLISLFCSFYFMPVDLAADINLKTPNGFPSWLSLSTLLSSSIAISLTLICVYLLKFISFIFKKVITLIKRKLIIKAFDNLSNEEREAVFFIYANGSCSLSDIPEYKSIIISLLKKEVLSDSIMVAGVQNINPLINSYVAELYAKRVDRAKSHH